MKFHEPRKICFAGVIAMFVAIGWFHPMVSAADTADAEPASSVALTPAFPLVAGTESVETLMALLVPAGHWRPYPELGDRAAWEALPSAARGIRVQAAEKLLGCTWPQLTATDFLKFTRTGNRADEAHYARRQMLATLVMAEAIEHRGRFMDDILNGVWAICEETTWAIPAALIFIEGDHWTGFPDLERPTVDLNASETAALLAWTCYLLGSEFDKVSPVVRARIRAEVDRRVLTPVENRDDFHWMGTKGNKLNNWNPWICSNWMVAALLLETDEARRAGSIAKAMLCLQRFIQMQTKDGACEEGPHYWAVAGAALYDCLWILESASAGKINWMRIPVVKPMGEYMVKSHIADRYFTNLGDGSAMPKAESALIYRYGRSVNSLPMMGLAAAIFARSSLEQELFQGVWKTNLTRYLGALFVVEELSRCTLREPLARDVWLPSLEFMAARDRAGRSVGFYVAAWAGNNGRSHGHNDVGNFIFYVDGKPILIDAGADSYSAQTFSPERYEIWPNQSAYHNLPSVNGHSQAPTKYLGYEAGRKYAAKDVRYACDDARASLELDLSGVYPEDAEVKSWRRSISLNRGEELQVRDSYELGAVKTPPVWNFMTASRPELSPGTIKLKSPMNAGTPQAVATLNYAPERFVAQWEEIELAPGPLRIWGEKLWRIQLFSRQTGLKDDVQFTFRRTAAERQP
jgi:hypothetical protein